MFLCFFEFVAWFGLVVVVLGNEFKDEGKIDKINMRMIFLKMVVKILRVHFEFIN
jgi:hypothetical protein